jgi:hypothetical protein
LTAFSSASGPREDNSKKRASAGSA